MRVIVRVDASTHMGWGHVKRCLALASALREMGADLTFCTGPSDIDVGALVRAQGFAHLPLACALNPAGMAAALALAGADVVLVDHYALDATWHDAVRALCAAHIVVIDDLADRPLAADLVIDQNPIADARRKYAPVLVRPARLLTGASCALLDPVYRNHARYRFVDTVASVGIFMGGSDPAEHSRWAWRACREQGGWPGPIEIATTSSNPHLARLQALTRGDPLLRLQVDAPNLADFHARHDLQIGAGGGALWERCCLGEPTLALICADNQRQSVPLLAEAGLVCAFDANPPSDSLLPALGRRIADLVASPAERLALHRRSLQWVDGQGAERVARAVLALSSATA